MTIRPPLAKTFYLTSPAPDVTLVTLQVDDQVMQAEITRDQLYLVLRDGAQQAYRAPKGNGV